jgi:hypothetical protein
LDVSITFREGFIGGAIGAIVLGIFLVWLWQPDHQVRLHSAHLLQKIEQHDWALIENAIALEYGDDWGDDRERLLMRLREVLRFTRNMKIKAIAPDILSTGRDGKWTARIQLEGDSNEMMIEIKQRINSLTTPFQLQWTRQSAKPWDWKLVRVSNRDLVLYSRFAIRSATSRTERRLHHFPSAVRNCVFAASISR